MTHIRVFAPGLPDRGFVEIDATEPTLLGRDPQPERGGWTARPVPIPSPSVSANHALVWVDKGEICLQDAGSRHGSWVRVPKGSAVRVRTEGTLQLHLSSVVDEDEESSEPEEADWKRPEEYPRAVAAAVSAWLDGMKIAADVTVSARRRAKVEHEGQLPLAGGGELSITPRLTMDGRWPQLLADVWRYVTRQNAVFESEEETRAEGLILASPAIRKAHRQVVEAAARGMRLLLLGPSGSGKEGLARVYHRHSGRQGPFVARNCALFSKEFLRAELFGAEPGAFTGATHKIVGAVERAGGGTLFLDEIGDLPTEVQPMLLRFLDAGEYEPLGSYGNPRHADVALVCATHKDLRAAVRTGGFRGDLWYRLSIQVVDVPPLAQRLEDVTAFLKLRSLGKASAWDALTPEAMRLLERHSWEGNFRELGNFAEQLPREAAPGSISAAVCAEALARVSLDPGAVLAAAPMAEVAAAPPASSGGSVWADLASTSIAAFAEDYTKGAPESWDDVKGWVEKYLKPLVFAHLTRAQSEPGNVQALAARVASDRGTAQKQLARWEERFKKG